MWNLFKIAETAEFMHTMSNSRVEGIIDQDQIRDGFVDYKPGPVSHIEINTYKGLAYLIVPACN